MQRAHAFADEVGYRTDDVTISDDKGVCIKEESQEVST